MNLSVIVPAYNSQQTIGLCLKALTDQDYKDPYEIIVVDDGSTDQTAEVIRTFPQVIYIYQTNAGPASARNTGAKVAQGQLVAFTDSDCVPHKEWISCLIEGFKKSDVAVVMGSYGIANPKNNLAWCIHKEIMYRHEKLLPEYPKVFGSYNFCVLKKVFDQVEGFNLSYRNASGEDNDLSYKILSAGWRIYFERKALVDHHHPTQIAKYLKEQFRHGFWRASMYWSHPGMIKGDDYTFWKDMAEVPLSVMSLVSMFLISLNLIEHKIFALMFILFFLIFEIYFAMLMIKNFSKEVFWGFIMFLRSFSRTLGLSTGILYILYKKILNKP